MANTFVDTTLLDGFADGPHVTAEQNGIANQGLYGPDDYVLNEGKKSEAQILTNNSIRIFDAVYVIQGRRDVIAANDYTDVNIDNGAQGMNRNDIIVRRYRKDESSEIEETEYAVIKGTPTSGTASDPQVATGVIRNGDTLHEMKLYRVKLNGLNIVAVEPLFNVLMNMSMINKSLSDISDKFGVAREDISKIKYAVTIHRAPQENYSYAFHCGSIVPLGNIEIPTYSKGMFISNGGNDGVLFAIDVSNKLYIGFRNGANWSGRVI